MLAIQLWAIVVIAILCSHTAPVRAQNFDAGVAAFRAGEFSSAFSQWRPLAEQGHARAQYLVGSMYEYGRGVGRNDVEALKWYRKAAEQDIARAQYRFGVLLDNGWGTARNDEEAVRWYAMAAEQGHALAQHDLAFMYAAGTGVPQDQVRAYMWLKIAVARGNDLMGKHLNHVAGQMSAVQIGKAEDLAVEWLERHRQ